MRRIPHIAAVLLTAVALLAACRESMGPRTEHDGSNPTPRYAALLAEVVTSDGYVDYDKLEANREPLDAFVSWMADSRAWRMDRSVDRPVDFINAYNALVLYQVLERRRPASVMEPRGLLPIDGAKFFATTQFKLGKEWLSLSEIEHERVRNMLLDYRVHAALNCASRSCPPLRRELYTRKALGIQLRDQMVRWMMDDRGVRFDGDKPVFNPIFEWYERDFRFWSAGESLCEIATKHTRGERQAKLVMAQKTGCKHTYFEYDWSLNHGTDDGE